jgi:hypothetical protein
MQIVDLGVRGASRACAWLGTPSRRALSDFYPYRSTLQSTATKSIASRKTSTSPNPASPFAPFDEVTVARAFRRDSARLLNQAIRLAEPNAPAVRLYHEANDKLVANAEVLAHAAPKLDFRYIAGLGARWRRCPSPTDLITCTEYGEDIKPPRPMKGCGCTDGCKPNDATCACLMRQIAAARAVGADYPDGFAYDDHGRLRYRVGDDVPILECNAAVRAAPCAWFETESLTHDRAQCGCPPDCRNRVVGRGRQLKVDLVATGARGWALYTAHDGPTVPAGAHFTTYAGEVVTLTTAKARERCVLGTWLLRPGAI